MSITYGSALHIIDQNCASVLQTPTGRKKLTIICGVLQEHDRLKKIAQPTKNLLEMLSKHCFLYIEGI